MRCVEVTYLEMLRPPVRRAESAPMAGASIEHVPAPTVELYRSLYDQVGRDWTWVDRRRLSDSALAAIIGHPDVELYVLRIDGARAGYAELDRRVPGETEIAYFGLLPDFIGRGLGSWFLNRIIDIAWAAQPRRVWLHTCTLDHPRALPNYLKAGFTTYRLERVETSL
jgi:GNAT superfamily N-acetyltransferase